MKQRGRSRTERNCCAVPGRVSGPFACCRRRRLCVGSGQQASLTADDGRASKVARPRPTRNTARSHRHPFVEGGLELAQLLRVRLAPAVVAEEAVQRLTDAESLESKTVFKGKNEADECDHYLEKDHHVVTGPLFVKRLPRATPAAVRAFPVAGMGRNRRVPLGARVPQARTRRIATGPRRFVGPGATLRSPRSRVPSEFLDTVPSAAHPVWRRHDGGSRPIFLHVTKTAGCSIARSREARGKLLWFGHVFAREFPEAEWSRLRTIVRNPFDRFVSAYFWVLKEFESFEPGSGVAVAVARDLGIEVGAAARARQSSVEGFERWVLRSERGPSRWADADVTWSQERQDAASCGASEVFLRQVEWLSDGRGGVAVPVAAATGRFEDLAAAARRLFGIEALPHLNSTEHRSWACYYRDPAVRRVVSRLYRPDFELLGYDATVGPPDVGVRALGPRRIVSGSADSPYRSETSPSVSHSQSVG